MATYTLTGVRIAGVTAAVPGARQPVVAGRDVPAGDFTKVVSSTGVKARHVVPSEMCTSDLCAAAATNLLGQLGWEKSSIDLLVFVTQTPDYVLPATACSLHGRLGLSKTCAAFDINLGCSGYVYGLSVASAHLQSGAAQRVLLLVGDTISKVVSHEDRSVAYLFGDAGTATALERTSAETRMHFVCGSDGSGADHLLIAAGMFRQPATAETRVARLREGGNVRSDEQLAMNGPEIFNFTIREVPAMITAALKKAGWRVEEVDAFVFHQANRFMLDYLVKRMKLPMDRVAMSLEDFGNTSSASIPLALCDRLSARSRQGRAKVILSGFGVGFSWASVGLEMEWPLLVPVMECPISV